jgi:hypothetical protein
MNPDSLDLSITVFPEAPGRNQGCFAPLKPSGSVALPSMIAGFAITQRTAAAIRFRRSGHYGFPGSPPPRSLGIYT